MIDWIFQNISLDVVNSCALVGIALWMWRHDRDLNKVADWIYKKYSAAEFRITHIEKYLTEASNEDEQKRIIKEYMDDMNQK